MKPITFRYYLISILLISSIGLNAQSEKIEKGRAFFSNGNYPSAVSLLGSITDCPDECKKLLADATQCKDWIEEADRDYYATDTVNLKRAINNYKRIQEKRGELKMSPDSVVEKKIKECENRIEVRRQLPKREVPEGRPDENIPVGSGGKIRQESTSVFVQNYIKSIPKIIAPFGITQNKIPKWIFWGSQSALGTLWGISEIEISHYRNNIKNTFDDDQAKIRNANRVDCWKTPRDIGKYGTIISLVVNIGFNAWSSCTDTKRENTGFNIESYATPDESGIILSFNF